MGSTPLRLPKQKILFAPFRGWDAVGAKSFGYETYWANRLTDGTFQLKNSALSLTRGPQNISQKIAQTNFPNQTRN
jgi:hypothetical protein